jgi:hypothetical protein
MVYTGYNLVPFLITLSLIPSPHIFFWLFHDDLTLPSVMLYIISYPPLPHSGSPLTPPRLPIRVAGSRAIGGPLKNVCVLLALKNAFPSRLPHHQCVVPGTDPMSSPYLRINCADPAEDSYPGRISDRVLTPSRTRISRPLVVGTTTVTRPTQECDYVVRGSCSPPRARSNKNDSNKHSPQQTQPRPTCAHTMGQDYPLTRPSPWDNPTIYPPFLAPARRGPPEGRIPKAMDFFTFLTQQTDSLS